MTFNAFNNQIIYTKTRSLDMLDSLLDEMVIGLHDEYAQELFSDIDGETEELLVELFNDSRSFPH